MNSSSHFARRVLLHFAALTAGAVLLRPRALAAADPSRKLEFLVLSDHWPRLKKEPSPAS
jgi:hypothetical protein